MCINYDTIIIRKNHVRFPPGPYEKRRVYGAFFEFALHFEPRLCLDAKRYLVKFSYLGKEKGVQPFPACEAMLHERGIKRERA